MHEIFLLKLKNNSKEPLRLNLPENCDDLNFKVRVRDKDEEQNHVFKFAFSITF